MGTDLKLNSLHNFVYYLFSSAQCKSRRTCLCFQWIWNASIFTQSTNGKGTRGWGRGFNMGSFSPEVQPLYPCYIAFIEKKVPFHLPTSTQGSRLTFQLASPLASDRFDSLAKTNFSLARCRLVSFAAVIRVITQRFFCVTTLITAAKETRCRHLLL